MSYLEIHIEVHEEVDPDIITALLYAFDFESYDVLGTHWKGYTQQSDVDWDTIISTYIPKEHVKHYEIHEIATQNWNEKWENEYPIVNINDQLLIKADFHETPKDFDGIEIKIQPKMSFGTGHHNTTALMAEYMLEMNMHERSVLDMGSGTGVLAILAEKLGADKIHAVDNEQWAYDNMLENCELNNCNAISCELSGRVPEGMMFDIIFANINKNVLLDFSSNFYQVLKPNGYILLSGFFNSDVEDVISNYKNQGFTSPYYRSKSDWAMCVLKK